MNYTPNYRLPQWERSDRILMDDFNHICAVTDTGAALADRLCRDAYRMTVQQRVHHGPAGDSDAMWINALSSLEEAGEGNGWNGRHGVHMGGRELPTVEGILKTAVEECYINTYPIDVSFRAAAAFTPDSGGFIETVALSFFSRSTPLFDFYITCTRLDTNQSIQAGPFRSTTLSTVLYFETNFPVEAGVPYRLETSLPDDVVFYGEIAFLLNSESGRRNETPMTFRGVDRASITKSVLPPPHAQRALGILRQEGSGTAILSVNGTPLTAGITRKTVCAGGKPCLEIEYPMDTLPDGEFTVDLEAERGEGSFSVFDYGFIWR